MKLLHFLTFLVLSFTTCCGKEIPMGPTLLLELEEQYNAKLAELRNITERNVGGWPSDHDCDAALWAGVARAAGAEWVEMDAALQPDGRPTRRPLRDCVTPDESKATTSNDMITGILLGLQAGKDDLSVLKLYQYGLDHNWIMGYPEWYMARVLLRPNGITLLARVLYQLTDGKRDYAIRLMPVVYGPVQADYEQHLILLSRIIEKQAGGAQYGMEVAEKILAKTSPLDGLAQAVAGNYTQAAILLTGDYTAPTYVRGHESYKLVHWCLAAKVTLDGALSR
jgi:hypothetical protein